ncbi:P-type conjugative transfer protein TrbL [Comamonas endophytica]|uniref:P-type conjugative transfer protein TrbL n=1 Tax=Comamonas endophytica TaxID=2949090 RepID=A0ABY6GFV4_9BURK|nr:MULTISPECIES: P-type conjugative transfer protein TrbL [unclassified Acidovorax]MCD2514659.1 P-type conjugative transfer protein TrbL [Acidovorax sp. D4N7]UYG53971.1 P-type conjugative transfer protein TrbL [Acidovorax sp. 5MLIR]UYG54010.1 P-type conjugative transfer protein TrbL [Acidovorax sp. 5MLIR]
MFLTRRSRPMFLVSALMVVVLTFFPGETFAHLTDPSGSLNGLLDLVKNSASSWDARLRGYAISIFWLLASIQFVWIFFPLIFRQADFGEIVGELIRFILIIGFFYALLLFSTDWGQAVVNSFREAGSHAIGISEKTLKPGAVFSEAIKLANTIGNVKTINPLTALLVSLSAFIVVICFTFIAAFMAVTLIESYIVIHASVLFMGFGGSQWTREFSLAMIRYAVSVGAKLFVLTLIVGMVLQSAKKWAQAYTADNVSMWTMVGLSLVCAYLAKTVPELVAGMINGSSMGGGSALGGMAAAGAAGAAAAVATIATAGAAAPAAGVLGTGGGAASGTGGGLAGVLNSSIGGNAGAGGGTSAAKSDLGATTGGSNAAATAPTRVGGNLPSDPAQPISTRSTSAVQQATKQTAKSPTTHGDAAVKASTEDTASSASMTTSPTSTTASPEVEASDNTISAPIVETSNTEAKPPIATPPVAATPSTDTAPSAASTPPAATAPTAATASPAAGSPTAASPAAARPTAAPPAAGATGNTANIPPAGVATLATKMGEAILTAAQKGPITGLQVASGVVKGTGILAAISVPGMEGAAGLSLTSGAPRVNAPIDDSDSFDSRSDPENIIRPSKPKGGKP